MKNNTTKKLLLCGALAGPLYVIAGLTQAVMREGFDMMRHPLSMLALGDWGWIHISNLILTGVLVTLGALGLRRVANGDKRWRRGALFVGFLGIGMIAGGVFVTDPALGFPPGTPNDYLATPSWHGTLHFIFGQLGFLAVIIGTFIYARYFAVAKQRTWAVYSAFTGALFLAAIIALGAVPTAAWALISLYTAIGLVWVWLTALTVHSIRHRIK